MGNALLIVVFTRLYTIIAELFKKTGLPPPIAPTPAVAIEQTRETTTFPQTPIPVKANSNKKVIKVSKSEWKKLEAHSSNYKIWNHISNIAKLLNKSSKQEKDIDLKNLYAKDAESYSQIAQCIADNDNVMAKIIYQKMDTAARDYICSNLDPVIKKEIENIFNIEILK